MSSIIAHQVITHASAELDLCFQLERSLDTQPIRLGVSVSIYYDIDNPAFLDGDVRPVIKGTVRHILYYNQSQVVFWLSNATKAGLGFQLIVPRNVASLTACQKIFYRLSFHRRPITPSFPSITNKKSVASAKNNPTYPHLRIHSIDLA